VSLEEEMNQPASEASYHLKEISGVRAALRRNVNPVIEASGSAS
jgi:hypothetical protein